jgi:hypothetical protein
MQLELALSESPATPPLVWDQLDPATRQAVIDRLALSIARAAAPAQQPEENGDE